MIKINIANIAQKHGLINAYALQKALNCSPTLANRLWKGNSKQIGIETMNRLCDLFDCKPSDLFVYSSSKVKPENPVKRIETPAKRAKTPPDGDFYTVPKASKLFGVTEPTLKRWLKDGKLKGDKVPNPRGGVDMWIIFNTPENVEILRKRD